MKTRKLILPVFAVIFAAFGAFVSIKTEAVALPDYYAPETANPATPCNILTTQVCQTSGSFACRIKFGATGATQRVFDNISGSTCTVPLTYNLNQVVIL